MRKIFERWKTSREMLDKKNAEIRIGKMPAPPELPAARSA
jgi:hypothetical protein